MKINKSYRINKFLSFSFVFFVISSLSISVCAHPPKNTKIRFNNTSKTITIITNHYTNDTSTHFVEIITISDRDSILATKTYNKQSNKEYQLFTTQLPTKKRGDYIKVRSHCNKFGRKTREFILP